MKQLIRLGALLTVLVMAFGATSAQAAPNERCFGETGYCIGGTIRNYWEANGGLAVFGYPIGPVQQEIVEGTWTGPVQWFERDRLEDHSNENKGVLAGRLGAHWLELTGRPWSQGGEGTHAGSACTKFDVTGYNVCPPFRTYWERNGGLERFGYPISGTFEEVVEGKTYLVQYFERRRMEYHPENAGTPYDVLLGLLGRDVLFYPSGKPTSCPTITTNLRRTWERFAKDLGCGAAYGNGQLATQRFEHGEMVWIGRADSGAGQIFVIAYPPHGLPTWTLYIDSYVEGEEVGTGEQPPAGKYTPTRGFGKLWHTVPQLREALGWAIEPEGADTGMVLQFGAAQGFHWMIHRAKADMVYILRAATNGNQVNNVARL